MENATRLKQGLKKLGIDLPQTQQEKLLTYAALLLKWNKTYNLTAIRDEAQVIDLHLLDSLTVLPYLNGISLADIGSGGGLPGIPLAICRPDLKVELVEAVHKKASFLQQAKIELDLKNLTVHCMRVEEWQAQNKMSMIISRAFSDLNEFVSLSKHALQEDGCFLAMKGVYPIEEIAQLPADFVVSEAIPLKLANLDTNRHLIIIRRN